MTKMQEQQQQTQLYKIRRRGGMVFSAGGGGVAPRDTPVHQWSGQASMVCRYPSISTAAGRTAALGRFAISYVHLPRIQAFEALVRAAADAKPRLSSLSSPRRAAASPPGAPDYSLNRRPVKRAHPALTELRVSATNEYPNSRVFLFSITHYVSRSYELLGMQD